MGPKDRQEHEKNQSSRRLKVPGAHCSVRLSFPLFTVNHVTIQSGSDVHGNCRRATSEEEGLELGGSDIALPTYAETSRFLPRGPCPCGGDPRSVDRCMARRWRGRTGR